MIDPYKAPCGLYRSIVEIEPHSWPLEDTFFRRDYLLALEEHCSEQLGFDYAILHENDMALAGALFQSIDTNTPTGRGLLRSVLVTGGFRTTRYLFDRFRGSLRVRFVICGNVLVAGEHGTWCRPELDPARYHGWLINAFQLIGQKAREPRMCLMLAFKDVGKELATAACRAGFLPVQQLPVMVLHLRPDWHAIADYVAALRSRYRRQYWHARIRGASVARRLLTHSEIIHYEERMNDLYGQVLSRARLVPVRLNAQGFARLEQTLGPRFSVVGYFDGSRLVAFNTRYVNAQDLESHYFGMDYSVRDEFSLYRNILYDDISDAIEMRLQRVVFGRDSEEVKSAVGARPECLHNLIYHDSRLMRKLVAFVASRLRPAEWVARHPFR